MSYSYRYPRPALTVDCVLFGFDLSRDTLKVLLIQRKNEPYKESWALPGGFVDMDENLEHAALRELQEETGIQGIRLKQFQTFGDPGRDPRGRVVSVAYWGLVAMGQQMLKAADDALQAGWYSFDQLPNLAFDHGKIISAAGKALRRICHPLTGLISMLPEQFPLADFQKLYTLIRRSCDFLLIEKGSELLQQKLNS